MARYAFIRFVDYVNPAAPVMYEKTNPAVSYNIVMGRWNLTLFFDQDRTEANPIVLEYEEVIIPIYTLTITSTIGGSTVPAVGSYPYDEGTIVAVTAYPTTGYVFDHWELDGISYTENPINVAMNTSHSLTAVFREEVIEYGDLIINVEGVEPEVKVVAEVNTYIQERVGPGSITFTGIYAKNYTCTVVAEGYAPKSFPVTVIANQVSNYSVTLSKCWIATAAYGTTLAPELYVLRRFRDRCLPNLIVALYYTVSPPIAKFLTLHGKVRRIVREVISVVVHIL